MRYLFFILLASFWLAACGQEHTQPEVTANTSFELAPDNTVRLKDERNDFPVQVLQIEDSRCPLDVTCVWAGEAKVQLLINDDLVASLCLGACLDKNPEANEAGFRLQEVDYKIILQDVQPYPAASQKQGPKKAVLTIKRVTL